MKKQTYTYPKSSFLALEKDMEILVGLMIQNERLKKLLYYTTSDCLMKPNLTEEETYDLFKNKKMIRMVPKIKIDGSVKNYIVINFDDFVTNPQNPEFRNNLIKIDIVCHYSQWELKDFQLRPYRIAAEIDSMLNHKRLTGIGDVEFLAAKRITLTNEFIGLCLIYEIIHGEEDKRLDKLPGDFSSDTIRFVDANGQEVEIIDYGGRNYQPEDSRAWALEQNFDTIFNPSKTQVET